MDKATSVSAVMPRKSITERGRPHKASALSDGDSKVNSSNISAAPLGSQKVSGSKGTGSTVSSSEVSAGLWMETRMKSRSRSRSASRRDASR